MQNFIQEFRETSIVSKKPGLLSEKQKTLTIFKYHRVQYFLLRFCTYFLLNNVYKKMFGIFFNFVQILSYLEVFKMTLFLKRFFYIFVHNSRPKQNQKNPKYSFVDIAQQKTCAKFQQKILNSTVLLEHSSQFKVFQTKDLVSRKQQSFI